MIDSFPALKKKKKKNKHWKDKVLLVIEALKKKQLTGSNYVNR